MQIGNRQQHTVLLAHDFFTIYQHITLCSSLFSHLTLFTHNPGHSSSSSSSKNAWTVPPAVQLSAQQLLTAVFDACLKALVNTGLLLQELLETAAATGGSSSSSRSKGGGGSSSKGGSSGKSAAAASAGGGGVGRSTGGGGLVQHSSSALAALKQQHSQQQHHHARSNSGGGGSGSPVAEASSSSSSNTAAAAAAASASFAAGSALDPLAALQLMQSGLLPASSVSYASGIASSIGATAATAAGSSGSNGGAAAAASGLLYAAGLGVGGSGGGGGGFTPAALQGLEWAKVGDKTPIGLLKTQCGHLWQEMQAEVLLLLSELLRANLKGVGVGAAGVQAGAGNR